jgi:hypothetical protein
MANLRWDGEDFRNPQDSSGSTAGLVSRAGKLQQGYNHGSLKQGLVAYYPMDAGSGSTLEDKTELGNDGAIEGSSWNGESKIGENCLDFDGEDDKVDLFNEENFRLPKFSISAWAKTSLDDGTAIFFRGDADQYEYLLYNTGGDSSIRVYVTDSSGSSYYAKTSAATDGNWHHFVGTWDGTELKIFMDGSLQESVEVGDITLYSSSGNVNIGYYSTGNDYFEGNIDEVRIYNRALSTPEIKALYNLSSPSKVSPADTLQ